MSLVNTETREFRNQLILTLKGSWCIIETSTSYVMGQLRNIDLHNLNLLLSPAIMLVGNSQLVFRSILIRGSDVKKILVCESESECREKLNFITRRIAIV